MENTRNFSNFHEKGGGDVRRRKRSRRSKVGNSCISARLNPDFDPKNHFKIHSCEPHTTEEINPKTLDFETLAGFLHPSFIYDYLQKTLYFLKSETREICFPNIAPYKEAFLVKIAQDNSYLKAKVLSDASYIVAKEILSVLEQNRLVYKWVHTYEDGRLNKNVLVYKKLFLDKGQNDQFKIPSITSSPVSLASSLEDMSLTDRQEVSPSFKTQTLNTMLKFIKDTTQLNLEYQEMSLAHAQFMYNLIQQRNTDSSVGFGFKSLYSHLYEAMKSVEEQFEFRISFLECRNLNTARILFQKIPKKNLNDSLGNNKKFPDLNASDVSTVSTHSSGTRVTKSQRDLMKKQKLVQSLSETFIRGSLERMLQFLEDDGRASLEFKDVGEGEARFLERLTSITRTTDQYHLLNAQCEMMLKRIERLSRRSVWKLRRTIGRRHRTKLTRTVTFFKEPFYESKSETLGNGGDQPNKISLLQLQAKPTNRMQITRTFNGNAEKETRRSISVGRRSDNKTHNSGVRDRSMGAVRRSNSKENRIDSKDNRFDSNDNRFDSKDNRFDSKDNRFDSKDNRFDSKDMRSECIDGRFKNVLNFYEDKDRCDASVSKNENKDIEERGDDSNVNSDMKPLESNNKVSKSDINVNSNSKDRRSTRKERRAISKERRPISKERRSISKDRRSISKDRRNASYRGGIAFHSAGSHLIDNTRNNVDVNSENDVNNSAGTSASVPGRRGKLLRDLAKPLESDRAERMMRMMGWDGGALGVRGEGITEPILPALHIAPGAGLGHVKQGAVKSQSATEFRMGFLQNLLSFLRSAEIVGTISFAQSMNKREKRFVNTAITSYNKRRNLGLNGIEEKDLVRTIAEEFFRKDQQQMLLHIDSQISSDGREIRVEKLKGKTVPQQKTSRRQRQKNANADQSYASIGSTVESDDNDIIKHDQILEIAKNLQDFDKTEKAATFLAYRVTYLSEIRKFLTNDDDAVVIKFDSLMNNKKKNFIEEVVADINKRGDMAMPTAIEKDIYREIRKLAARSSVFLAFQFSYMKICFQKKYYQKRFTNSALGLPPIVSKDTKKTIIYKNNVPIPAENIDAENPKHDDGPISNNKENDPQSVIDVSSGNEYNHGGDPSDIPIMNDRKNNCRDVIILNSDIEDVMPNDKTKDDAHSHDYDDLIDTDFECTDDSISLDISNDSLMLEELENNNLETLDATNVEPNKLQAEIDVKKHVEVNNNKVKNIISDENEGEERNFCMFEKLENESNSMSSTKSYSVNQLSSDNPKFVKNINIIPTEDKEMNIDLARIVQKLISAMIDENDVLPLLKCHGIQNGGLVYSCHTEKSFEWLKDVLSVASGVKIIESDFVETKRKVKVTLKSYLKDDVKTVFRRLEMYNPELKTNNWIVLEETIDENFVDLILNVDENSFKYICENGCALYAGTDSAKFNIIWD